VILITTVCSATTSTKQWMEDQNIPSAQKSDISN